MTISELGSGLNAVKEGLQFAHFAWSSAPAGDYGIYAEDGKPQFDANNRYAEHTTHAYVHLFTRDDSGATAEMVEDYFTELQDEEVFVWTVNTIQYEDNTKFIHIEWEVEFA